MRALIVAALTAVLLCACQTPHAATALTPDGTGLSAPATAAIAGDMASRLAEQASPAIAGPLTMRNDKSPYAVSLEAALKGWGYTVTTDAKVKTGALPTHLAWSIADIDGQVFARLSMPTLVLGRTYMPTVSGADPASPLSVMRAD